MKFAFSALVCFFVSNTAWGALNAEEILKKSDSYRNPSESFEMKIRVEAEDRFQVFDVYLKGQDKTMIVTKEPSRDVGRNMLMLDRDFHAYVPNLKRSMRLSLAQKLSGQVANGDIARTRWSGDYVPKIEKETPAEIELLLKANKQNLTYEWIRLWVDKKDFRPLRTEYLALNGQTLLKAASFEDFKKMAGALRPSVIRIKDPGQKESRILILEMKENNKTDSFFTVRSMESQR